MTADPKRVWNICAVFGAYWDDGDKQQIVRPTRYVRQWEEAVQIATSYVGGPGSAPIATWVEHIFCREEDLQKLLDF